MVCGRYILIYPQGCDVCNHLSLFLCVANHDKLLPGLFLELAKFALMILLFGRIMLDLFPPSSWVDTGWSHFAQFTIAVVNKDPKKSKYSGPLVINWLSYLSVQFLYQHC